MMPTGLTPLLRGLTLVRLADPRVESCGFGPDIATETLPEQVNIRTVRMLLCRRPSGSGLPNGLLAGTER